MNIIIENTNENRVLGRQLADVVELTDPAVLAHIGGGMKQKTICSIGTGPGADSDHD